MKNTSGASGTDSGSFPAGLANYRSDRSIHRRGKLLTGLKRPLFGHANGWLGSRAGQSYCAPSVRSQHGTVQGSADMGIFVNNGSSAQVLGVMIVNNLGDGMDIQGQSLVTTNSTIANNGGGIVMKQNAMLRCNPCQITGNAEIGIVIRRDSSANFQQGSVITGNSGGGVLLSESSSAFFAGPATVTGNPDGMDVVCGSSFTTAKGATLNLGGGTTNCAEPAE